MGREAKPWFRKQTGCWYVERSGRQINLGRDKEEAMRQFHRIMGEKEKEAPPPDYCSAAEMIDHFLEWTQNNREAETYAWYKKHLQAFSKAVADIKSRPAEAIKPIDVLRWVDKHTTWSASYKRGAMTAVQRAFAWGTKSGLIERNPVAHLEKPAPGRREEYITPEEFKTILSHVQDEEFRSLLNFCWWTGARPQEARQLEAWMLVGDVFVLPAKQSKGKKAPARIFLNGKALKLAKKLVKQWPEGQIFRNTEGNPWTAYSVNCRFTRLKKHVGKKYCQYLLRHSYGQRKLEEGHDHLTVAQLMNHKDGTMLARVYSHLNKADDHLRKAAKDRGA